MTEEEKLPTEKQIAIYDMLDAKCTVTDEGVQGFMTWEQIRDVYNSLPKEPISKRLEEASIEFSKQFGDWQYAIPCFKAGVQWDRKQGITKAAVIGMATEDIIIQLSQRALDELGAVCGDKVIVQIRNKED